MIKKEKKLAIIGPWNYDQLDLTMYKCIRELNYPIFTVVCGCTHRDSIESLISYKWAVNNNIPIEFIITDTIDEMLDKLVQQIDFAIILFHKENRHTRKFIMQLREAKKSMRIF